ncbi:asparagine synthase (glutamine-hydrolyzing) [bacterium AH-315-M05]|nr:asparagine synthase (glutamine-hydrolyzing) [bacterium AH-315-M05]
MCGIAGFYSQNKSFTKEGLIQMTSSLAHRGPDAEGYFQDEVVGLGHKRLSIIDLSDAANQPMHSLCNRYVIIYNGEVYNFKEIAQKLNIQFKTTSDTEVILESFAKWGLDFVNKLNGMFALAIYDKQEKKLFLFRDRMGIKPLFYYWDGKNFAFASELKSLLKLKLINENKALNNSAISIFLHLGYIPEPLTIYQNIYKFPSGHYSIISTNNLSLKKYWNIEENVKSELICDFMEAKSKLNELLISSVKYRLVSDVPYGTFLSGGTDSSLITAIAQKITDQPVKTFSVGFKESKYNEAPYSKAIADYLGTDHHEFIVSYKDAIPLVEQMINVYDEPYSDSSAIPTMLISKLARQHVTMTLSGDGGDELFFGYGSYKWAKRLTNPYLISLKTPISYILSKSPNRYKRMEYLLKYWSREKSKSHISSQEQYLFSEHEIQNMLTNEYKIPFNLDEDYLNSSRKLTPIEEQAIFDIKYYLKDDLLVKVDRASMKYSLENRVPLLDHRIVEFALNLSPSLKIKGKNQKYLLKEVLYDYIPNKYFKRPKWGFAIPLNLWLKNELKYLIDDYLSEQVINKYAIVKYPAVKKLKDNFFNGHDYLYNRLWALIVLHKWLSTNESLLTTYKDNYHQKCVICQSSYLKPLNTYKKVYLVKCTNCTFVFAQKIPSVDELIEHYNDYEEDKYLSPITVKRYNELLDSFEIHRKTNRILDIGCGRGYFLKTARERGWDVFGTEYTDKAIRICSDKGIPMHQGQLNPSTYKTNFFDIITMFEVIEHINNPREEIKSIENILRPEGVFYFTTPNFNSLNQFILRNKWNIVRYPDHLCYYTRKTINHLLNEFDFKKRKLDTTGYSITRLKTSLKISEQKCVSQFSDDERIRTKIDKYKFLKLISNLLNKFLSISGTGDTIKGTFQKRQDISFKTEILQPLPENKLQSL